MLHRASLFLGRTMWVGLVVCGWLFGAVAWAQEDVPLALGTKPEGASFQLLDAQGKRVLEGKTPFVGKIASGVYRLVIQQVGYYDESRSLRVEVGKPVFLNVEMIVQTGPWTPPVGAMPPPLVRGVSLPPATRLPATNASSRPTQARVVPARLTPPSSAPVVRDASPPPPPDGRTDPRSQDASPKTTTDTSPNAPPDRALPPPVSQPTTRKKVAATQPTKKADKTPRSIPWVPLAIAAACGIAGGVFFGLSQGSLDAANDRKRTQIDAYSEHLNAQSNRTTAFSLLIAGGAALAVAGLMYSGILKSRSSASRTSRDDRYAPMTSLPPHKQHPTQATSKRPSQGENRFAVCNGKKQGASCLAPTRLLSLDSAGEL